MWTGSPTNVLVVLALLGVAVAQMALPVPLGDLTFVGSWHQSSNLLGCGSMYWTNQSGATASYTFAGTGFSLTIPSFNTSGTCEYQIDGGTWMSRNFLSSSSKAQCTGNGFSTNGLSYQNHTLVLQHTSNDGSITAISELSYNLAILQTGSETLSSSSILPTTSDTITTSAPDASTSDTSGQSVDSSSTHPLVSWGVLAGIIAAGALALLIALLLLLRRCCRGRRSRGRARDAARPRPYVIKQGESTSTVNTQDPWKLKTISTRTSRSGAYSPAPLSGRPWDPRRSFVYQPGEQPEHGLASPSPRDNDRGLHGVQIPAAAASADSLSLYSVRGSEQPHGIPLSTLPWLTTSTEGRWPRQA